MLSRVANNLFWLDRYVERSYGILNLLKTNYNSTLDSGNYSSWGEISKTYVGESSKVKYENYDDTLKLIYYMLFNRDNPNTLINLVTKARENARSVQEHISREVWLSVNKYYLHVSGKNLTKRKLERDPLSFINNLILYNHIYYSSADISQERGNAYCFMNLGKYFERIIQIVDFLSVRVKGFEEKEGDLSETFFWKNLLISVGGYQLYIKTYKSIFRMDNIIEMLCLNSFFPRSIKYSIDKLHTHLTRLIEYNMINDKELIFTIGKLKNSIDYTSFQTIKKKSLTVFLDEIIIELNFISILIGKVFFSQKYL